MVGEQLYAGVERAQGYERGKGWKVERKREKRLREMWGSEGEMGNDKNHLEILGPI